MIFGWFSNPHRRKGFIDVGLKAVNLLAPLPFAADTLVTGDRKAGVRVLGNELALRLTGLAKHPLRVIVYLDAKIADAEQFGMEIQETLQQKATIFVVDRIDAREVEEHRSSKASVSDDAIIGYTEDQSFATHFLEVMRQLRNEGASKRTLTSVLVSEQSSQAAFDAVLDARAVLAKRALFPALDPRTCRSVVWERTGDSRMAAASERWRQELVGVIASLESGAEPDAEWSYNRDPSLRPQAQALWYLSQPFFVAEPYTGLKSAWIDSHEAEVQIQEIFSGKHRSRPLSDFLLKNQVR